MSYHDPAITPAQRAYLDAFDRFLRGEPGAADEKGRALLAVLDEAGVDRSMLARPRRFRREASRRTGAGRRAA